MSLVVGTYGTGNIASQLMSYRSGKQLWSGSMGVTPKSWVPPERWEDLDEFKEFSFLYNEEDIPIVKNKDCEPGTTYQKLGFKAWEVNSLPKVRFAENIISQKNWTTYKVGVLHTEEENGFIKIYQDDDLIFQYCGFTGKTDLPDRQVDIRIGMYRSYNPTLNLEQEILYDDFTVTDTKRMLDAYLGIGRRKPNSLN